MLHIFDLDGTLIDSNGVWFQIDLDFLALRGLPHSRAYSDYVASVPFYDAAVYTKEVFALPETVDEIIAIWSDMAQYAYAHTIGLKPGVLPYLKHLRAKGEWLALATSCMDHLCRAALKNNGIDSFFPHVTTLREVERDKSHPDIYLLAAQKANVPPNNCMVYEDSPVGCKGALAAGMYVVGVYDPLFACAEAQMRKDCHRYIKSFTELL